MTDPLDAKAAALAALAAWSATSRRELVAAAWRAGNRDISELARVAGFGRQAIYQDLQKSGINPPTDREEPPVPVPTTDNQTPVPVAGWRHPNLLSVTVEQDRFRGERYNLNIKPFTGDEPEPTIPKEWGWHEGAREVWSGYDQRKMEIRWLREAWATARYRRLFKALYTPGPDNRILEDFMRKRRPDYFYSEHSSYHHPVGYTGTAADRWQEYVTARDALAAAYEAMKNQPDNMWRSGLGRILDHTEPAEKAARAWDDVAEAFVDITRWHEDHVNDRDSWPGTQRMIQETGKALGLDVTDWLVAYDLDEYQRAASEYGDTAQAKIISLIDKGQQWLKGVGELAARAGKR